MLISVLFIVLLVAGILYSIILHEIAHGYIASKLGDDTAKVMGRLSLNPLAHIDPFGTVLLPLSLFLLGLPVFGWAKPVPVNPNKMEKPNEDFFIVSLAGPITNFIIALILGLTIRFLPIPEFVIGFLATIVQINLVLMIFNLIPIPPLDGSKVLGLFLPEETFLFLQQFGIYILIFLLLFSSTFPFIQFIINRTVNFFFNLITGQNI